MRKLVFLFVFLCCWLFPGRSQQNDTWYFGVRAGLGFTALGPGPLPYPVQNNAMVASEGCSSICDITGNILFYSNGRTIFNRNGQVMQNGDNLGGHESSFQPVIIVPLPDNRHLYYVFTADAYEDSFANGYRYSIVDMDLDNGRGAVTLKNILLQAPGCERLAAARHANGIDAWIITNDYRSNVFRAWRLTCSGLQPSPVVSTIGAVLNQYPYINIGSIKISPDGKRLCQTHFPDPGDDQGPANFFQLFDFDNSTGILSNVKNISIPSCRYYACEFSPNSKLLYVTKADGGEIDQFDCTLATPAEVAASQFVISAGQSFTGLQLAPDAKIYATYYGNMLSVITRPNIPGGGSSFELNKIDMAGQAVSLNLPSFINDLSLSPDNYFTARVIDTCAGIVQFNVYTTLPGANSWAWDFGDGSFSTLPNPVHDFPATNRLYLVKLTITSSTQCGYIEKAKNIAPGGILARADFGVFNNCDSGYTRFENRSLFFPDIVPQYTWDFGDGNVSAQTDPVHVFAASGIYNVKLSTDIGPACINDVMIRPVDYQVLDIQAPPDLVIDEGQSVQLTISGGGNSFQWQPADWLSDPRSANPFARPPEDVLYIITAQNDLGCADTDSVFIKVNAKSDLFIPSAFTPNNDGKNDIFKPTMSQQFRLVDFSIYNRWGQRVFITRQRDAGWNGKINGVLQDTGVYVWELRVDDKNKQRHERRGTLLLIR